MNKVEAELAATKQNHEWIKSELDAALVLANRELDLIKSEKDKAVAEAEATRSVCVQLKKKCDKEQEVYEQEKQQWHEEHSAALSQAMLCEDNLEKERAAHVTDMSQMAQELQTAEAAILAQKNAQIEKLHMELDAEKAAHVVEMNKMAQELQAKDAAASVAEVAAAEAVKAQIVAEEKASAGSLVGALSPRDARRAREREIMQEHAAGADRGEVLRLQAANAELLAANDALRDRLESLEAVHAECKTQEQEIMAEHAAAALKTMETHLGEMEKMKTQQDELQKQLQDLQAEKVNEADSAAHANGELADALQSQEALKLELQKSNERFSKSERLKVARVGEMQQRMESPEMQQSVERAAANHETESKKALQQALQDQKTRASEMQARLDTLQAEKEMVEQSAQSRCDTMQSEKEMMEQSLQGCLNAMQSEKEKLEQRLQSIKEAEYTELLFILRALGNSELSDKLEHETGAMEEVRCLEVGSLVCDTMCRK